MAIGAPPHSGRLSTTARELWDPGSHNSCRCPKWLDAIGTRPLLRLMAKPWEGRTSRVRGRPTEEPDQLSDAKCQIKFQLLPPSQPVRPPRITELDAHNQQQIRGLVSANVRDALRQIRDAAVEYFGSECV